MPTVGCQTDAVFSSCKLGGGGGGVVRTKRTPSSHFPLVFSLPPLLGTILEGKKAHVITMCRGIKDLMDGKLSPYLSVIYLVHSRFQKMIIR